MIINIKIGFNNCRRGDDVLWDGFKTFGPITDHFTCIPSIFLPHNYGLLLGENNTFLKRLRFQAAGLGGFTTCRFG